MIQDVQEWKAGGAKGLPVHLLQTRSHWTTDRRRQRWNIPLGIRVQGSTSALSVKTLCAAFFRHHIYSLVQFNSALSPVEVLRPWRRKGKKQRRHEGNDSSVDHKHRKPIITSSWLEANFPFCFDAGPLLFPDGCEEAFWNPHNQRRVCSLSWAKVNSSWKYLTTKYVDANETHLSVK